ncbi:hypothetical protein [Filimonas effusa]|uniref:Uncharacterized protein n=1 Tax=Filimonas effusa TaxID=2508721 RepID=A0A4V1M9L8_9BACT|nr:hypothetical protein [Filimonas effusa]RXK81660.1 hypothetical protein ESB13_17830 [Filimonas effusa]
METNRVEVAMNRWDAKQAGYIQKFGPELLQDREFNLLRLQVWKRIVDQHKKLNLTEGEYDDLQFVKGQIRQMDATLFPGLKGFFQKLNYTVTRAIDRIFNGKPAFLNDSGMLAVTPDKVSVTNSGKFAQSNQLSAVYVSPQVKADQLQPPKQSENVAVLNTNPIATPFPQPFVAPKQEPENSPVLNNEPETKVAVPVERKSFHRDREIKTTTGGMRTLK